MLQIDPEDEHLAYEFEWLECDDGYFARLEKSGQVGRLHRYVAEKKYGRKLLKGEVVHHKNSDRQDNRRENLVLTDRAGNMQAIGPRKGSTSKYKGVCFRKDKQRWQATINAKGTKHLGYFDTEEQAAEAYNQAVKKYHGPMAYINPLN